MAATTILVAASDSSLAFKSSARFICDGVDDQKEINAAFAALPPGGGTVLLSDGTFSCRGTQFSTAGDIVPAAHSTLQGQGQGTTTIRYTGSRGSQYYNQHWGNIRLNHQYVTLRDFSLTNTGYIFITENNNLVQNVTVSVTGGQRSSANPAVPSIFGAFYIWSQGRDVANVSFLNCTSLNSKVFGGFQNEGGWVATGDFSGTPRTIRNVRYINCKAINNGGYSDWDVGFDLAEHNVLENAVIQGCLADGSWESGFHFEGVGGIHKNITFKDCVSRNNGRKPGASWGAGYLVTEGIRLENCTSDHNIYGFYSNTHRDVLTQTLSLINCTDNGSRSSFRIYTCNNAQVINCESKNSRGLGLDISAIYQMTMVNFTVHNPSGNGITCLNIGDEVRNSMLNIYGEGCRSDIFLLLKNVENLTVSGELSTGAPVPVDIKGMSTKYVNIVDFQINETGTDPETTGIQIEPDIRYASTIQIKDSVIRFYNAGTQKRPGIRNLNTGKITIENVTVIETEQG